MKEVMDCPYGEGKAVLKKSPQQITFRKEVFDVVAHFYVCEDCGEEFTTNEADEITLVQAYNQYRAKHGIPFPDEIRATREKYHLSAAKMSEVLQLGENGYANYEKGEMPTPAIGTLIRTAAKPENFIDLLTNHRHFNHDKALQKALGFAEALLKEVKSYDFFHLLNKYHHPDNYTGYVALNTTKIEHLLVHFIRSCAQEYNDRLKLGKLLFFTDFYHYRQFGRSVSGLAYKKINVGPVPRCYDHFFTFFEHQHVLYPEWEPINGKAREIVRTYRHLGIDEIFSEQEKHTIFRVTELFKHTATWELVDKSNHLNIKSESHDHEHLIGFQENAFELAGV